MMDTKKLRQKVLDLAIRGKLVPQDPNDEPASVLLERIRAEKERIIKEGKIKRDKKEKISDKSHYEKMPFEVPESWVWCSLGELCDYGTCKSITPKEIPDNAWILDLEDIEKDTAKLLQRTFKTDRITTSMRHSFSKGNVLYSKLRTYLNKVLVADIDGFSTTEILPLDFKGFVVPEYARYVLMSKMFLDYTTQCGYGVKMPRLGTTDGKKALFPLPPLSEQFRLVAVIESAFALIDDIENSQLSLTQIIKQAKSKLLDLAIHGKLVPQNTNDEPASVLLERIGNEQKTKHNSCDILHYPFEVPEGWNTYLLQEICTIYTGNSINETVKLQKYTDIKEGHNYIGTKDIDFSNNINYENGIKIPLKEIECFKIAKNSSVLLCIEGGSAGRKIGIVTQDVCFGNKLCCFFSSVANQKFLYYYMQSHQFRELFSDNKIGLIGGVSVNTLKKLQVNIPPLAEQQRIVAKIEQIFAQLDEIENSIKA